MKFLSMFTAILIVFYVDITTAASNGFPNRKPTTPTPQPQSADCISTLVFRPGQLSHIREGPYRSQARDIRQMPFAKVVEIFPWLNIAVQQSLLFEWSEHTLFFECILEYFGTEYILELAEGMSGAEKRRICGCEAMKTAKANKRGRVVVNDNEEAFCRGPPLDLVDRMAYCDAIRGKIRQYFPAYPQHWEHYLEELPAHLNSLNEGRQPLTPRMWSILLRDEASSAAVGNTNTNNAAAARIPTVSTASAAAHPDTGIHHFGPPQLPVHFDEPNVDVVAVEVASENEHPISQPTSQQTRFPVMDCPPTLVFRPGQIYDDTPEPYRSQLRDMRQAPFPHVVEIFPWLRTFTQQHLLLEWSEDDVFFGCILQYFGSLYIRKLVDTSLRGPQRLKVLNCPAMTTAEANGWVGVSDDGEPGRRRAHLADLAVGTAVSNAIRDRIHQYFPGNRPHWEAFLQLLPADLNNLARGNPVLTPRMWSIVPRLQACRAAVGHENRINAGAAQSTSASANPFIREVGETGSAPQSQIPTTSTANSAHCAVLHNRPRQLPVHLDEVTVDNERLISQLTAQQTGFQLTGCTPELRFNMCDREDPATEFCLKYTYTSREVLDLLQLEIRLAVSVFPWLPIRVQQRLLYEWSADQTFFECICKYFGLEYILAVASNMRFSFRERFNRAINTFRRKTGRTGTAHSQNDRATGEVATRIAGATQSERTALHKALSDLIRRIFGRKPHWESYIRNFPTHLDHLAQGQYALPPHMLSMIPSDEACRAAGDENTNNADIELSTIASANPSIGEVDEKGDEPHSQIPTISGTASADTANTCPISHLTTQATQFQLADCVATLVFRPKLTRRLPNPYGSQVRDIQQAPFAQVVEIFPWLNIVAQQRLLLEWSQDDKFFGYILEYFTLEYIRRLIDSGMVDIERKSILQSPAMKTAEANRRVVENEPVGMPYSPKCDFNTIRDRIRRYFPGNREHWEQFLREIGETGEETPHAQIPTMSTASVAGYSNTATGISGAAPDPTINIRRMDASIEEIVADLILSSDDDSE